MIDRGAIERAWLLQLVKEFHDIVEYYGISLKQPFLAISESRSQYGSWQSLTRTLTLSRHLIEEHNWDVVLEIFKHELAHMWVTERGRDGDDDPHGVVFQEACRRLGVAPWARSATVEIDPNTARTQHRKLSDEKERQVRRVEKLLSLAQSSNPNEAALAMERARELSIQYQIEMQSEQRNYTYVLINHKKKVLPSHQSSIGSILTTHFYVDCVSRSQYDAETREHHKVLEILGSVENVQIAEYVYWYLWRELPLLWDVYAKALVHQKRRASRRSYYLGVLNGFREKLSRERERAAAEASVEPGAVTGQALITLDKSLERILKLELKTFVNERFPRLQTRSGSRSSVEESAYKSGVARGQTLDMRQGISTQTRQHALSTGRNT